ncbi:MAG: DJ-1/PfpI family protein [Vulcanimicrobiaceae bacterium]
MQSVEGKRIAALVSDGFEEMDLVETQRVLEEAGAAVTIVGVDERSRQRIRGKRGLDEGAAARAEELVADCTAEDFDGLLIPGGTSPDRLRIEKEVQRFVRELDLNKKPIFSIGHGTQVLISAQLVRGRQVTGAHSIADDIRNAGGLYRDQPTVQDSNWISTRGGEDLAQFHRAVLEKLSVTGATPIT